ncbi:histidinolphosphatase [Cadophora gregata]|uniref:histidinolphosphatase n=1 Tax=Cadophora gregata TaxID=51156 RepID=UPI0026DCCBE6|nr:histidinolphosphatase [Cadophora gregata]KAK0115710.1 histidinolphosphatase [Cadophora gregata f. sp. sojae]KAK0128039.1 histidinolphosphatase [Cadophora gregata]
MAFSMHSHSGQFCPGHAKDSLEEVIQTAISRGMQTFALTEHMPRLSDEDRYPEEIAAGDSVSVLLPRHESFLIEAQRLRAKYASQITILIGFEGEWIRPSYGPFIKELASNPIIDYFIGSVHHVHTVPIDYDVPFYTKARDIAGGTDERLFEDYFDLQYEMLVELKPRVVGHFDLIRLLSSKPNASLKEIKGVWERVVRNLKVVVEQGGLLEINSSGLRKGLEEPYPIRCICEEFLRLGGQLTLSDDSHGIVQVGTNFERAIAYLESLGVEEVFTLQRKDTSGTSEVSVKCVALKSVKESFKL